MKAEAFKLDDNAIFRAALKCSSAEQRATYLDTVCGNDIEQRARLEQLLAIDTVPTIIAPDGDGSARTSELDTSNSATEFSNSVKMDDADLQVQVPEAMSQSASPSRLGEFELQEVLGRGGMGIVTKAFDIKLRRFVAIKTLSAEFSSHPQARIRFLREAQAAAAVRHDNVVTIHTVNDQADATFLVMEYIQGKSLQQRLGESGPLPIHDVVRIGMQIAAGLAAAHSMGLVHRDIKPANILLEGESERVKITDFGLARAICDVGLTQTGQVAGTPQFMSPEQAHGVPVDSRSDLFSLGSVMYAMSTAKSAFHAESAVVVLRRVCDDQPIPIRKLRPDVPIWLCEIIDKLMAKRPEDRFQTAGEVELLLKSNLEKLTAPAPATSVAPPTEDPPASPRDRQILVVSLIGLALLLIAGIAAFQPLKPGPGAGQGPPPSIAHTTSVDRVSDPKVDEPANKTLAQPNLLLAADYEWSVPVNLGPGVNTTDVEEHPTLSNHGLRLNFVRHGKLMESSRSNISEAFGDAILLPGPVNEDRIVQGPFMSDDGLNLWYASPRSEESIANDIWTCHRTGIDQPFSKPENLGAPINTTAEESTPSVSSDGLTMLLCGDRPESVQVDILRAMRSSIDKPFGEPELIDRPGPQSINRTRNQFFPRMTADQCALVFTTVDATKRQYFRMCTRSSKQDPFGPPVDLPATINRNIVSAPAISSDGATLVFESNRVGGRGRFDLWESQRVPRKKLESKTRDQDLALKFDGQSTYAVVPGLSRYERGPCTLEGWFRPEIQTLARVVMLLSGPMHLQIGKSESHFFPFSRQTQYTKPMENPHFTPSQWVHLALVNGEKNLELFVNGVRRLSVPISEMPVQNAHTFDGFWIGAHLYERSAEEQVKYHFRGQMDEIRVSSVARYDRDFKPQIRFVTDEHTRALYHFDEGAGAELIDSSGNNLHGRFENPVWVIPEAKGVDAPSPAPVSAESK